MAGNWLWTVLGLCGCALLVAGGKASTKATRPVWPTTYQVDGQLQLPYAEIDEPFNAYYDETAQKSRIDYYGTVITIQIGANTTANKTDYGNSYKITPVTTKDKPTESEKACFLIPGTNDSSVAIQPLLPDLAAQNYTDAGTEKVGNVTLNKWIFIETIGSKKNTYTIWVDQTDAKSPVPVRFEMIGYDSLFGSHYDRYYILYKNYVGNKKIDPSVFEVPKDFKDKCGDFPGPGDADHKVLANPMGEFVHGGDSHVDPMFDKFKKIHKKGYSDKTEHEKRKNYFKQNLRFIHSKNRANLGYTLAINHLADMKDTEVALMRGRLKTKGYNGGLPFDASKYNLKDIPDHLDWRLYGAVTPVKDQAVCGSCWSFGTTGTIEGSFFLKTGTLMRLSQQELVDCSWATRNNGCDGGEDFLAYQYIIANGLDSEESYGPYLGQDSTCRRTDKPSIPTLKGYVNVSSPSVKDVPTMLNNLKIAIAKQGPISIGIDASQKSFSFYSHGVYYDENCKNDEEHLDHAVLNVGYGVLNGEPYWLVKNSWSTHWGNDGYILMSWKHNNCGPATAPTFVML